MSPIDPRRLLTEDELEAARSLTKDFLRYDRRTRRLIPFVQIGRSIRYRLGEVDRALDEMVVGGVQPPGPGRRPGRRPDPQADAGPVIDTKLWPHARRPEARKRNSAST